MMNPKTARRFLVRNAHKIARRKIDGVKRSGFVKTCLKVLRYDIKTTRAPASIRTHNKFLHG